MYTKRTLVPFHIVGGTVCRSSAHEATLKIEVISPLLHDAQISHGVCHPEVSEYLEIFF